MKLQTRRYDRASGWNSPLPAELDSSRTLLLAFADPSFLGDPSVIAKLGEQFPNSTLLGCSTAGCIQGTQIFDNGISLAIARFDKSDIKPAWAPITSAEAGESYKVGKDIATELIRPDLKAVLVLSDGLMVNGSELVRGLGAVLPKSVVIAGGLAGDGSRFKETWIIRDAKPSASYVSAVGFYGDHLRVSAGSQGGWDVFGPERLVTKSSGNILFELDGKPALSLYKDYLGARAAELPSSALLFPLSLRHESIDRKGLVRTVLSVDEKQQSMTFAGDIPEGSRAQLMKANFTRLVEGASGAAGLVAQGDNVGPTLAVAISCVGRRLVLGVHTEDETEATMAVLGEHAQQVGFYSYGEISPLANGKCDLHNQTMTLSTFSEV